MLDKGTDLIKCQIKNVNSDQDINGFCIMQNKKVSHHQILLHDHNFFHNFRTIRQGLGDIVQQTIQS